MNCSKGKYLAKYKTTLHSIGVNSFDNLIGGGLPTGTITLFEEDFYNRHCRLLTKYFVSCGVSCNHKTCVILDTETESYIKNLPRVVTYEKNNDSNNNSNMNIAWRYNKMKPIENDSLINNEKTAESIDISVISAFSVDKENLSDNLEDVLKYVKEFIENNSRTRKPLRIMIGSLGSIMWGSYGGKKNFVQSVTRFLITLKTYIIGLPIVVVLTSSNTILQDERGNYMQNVLRNLSNAVYQFEAFDDPLAVKEQIHNDITGRVKLFKLPIVNSIEPLFRPNTDIWSYLVKRKRMQFKEFSLPPCLSEATSRTNQSGVGTDSTSSTASKPVIDF